MVAEYLANYEVPPELLSDAHGNLERLHRLETWMRREAARLPGLDLSRVDWRRLAQQKLR